MTVTFQPMQDMILADAFDATWARATYLSLASFHAYLELAFLGRWLVGASARA